MAAAPAPVEIIKVGGEGRRETGGGGEVATAAAVAISHGCPCACSPPLRHRTPLDPRRLPALTTAAPCRR
jgi:hypothetical protein